MIQSYSPSLMLPSISPASRSETMMYLCSCTKLQLMHMWLFYSKTYAPYGHSMLIKCRGQISDSPWYGLGRAGRERRVMVDLLQDFLVPVRLTGGHEGPSVFAVGISCLFSSEFSSPADGVCVMGETRLVRGDLCGGAVLGLVDAHLLDVCFTEFILG